MMIIREILYWLIEISINIPGKTGCYLRKYTWGYKSGRKSFIWNNTQVRGPKNLIIGDNVSINRNCVINAGGGVFIHNNVLIGPNVIIYSQNHKFRDISKPIIDQGYSRKKVVIEEGVWIGAGCIILPGVNIGKNSIIPAGSVIRNDVPKSTIYKAEYNFNPIKRHV